MIFHNIKTMLIGDFAEMLAFNDLSKIKRYNIWIPEKILIEQQKKLIYKWNEISNEDKIIKDLLSKQHKIKLLTQINIIYPIMLKMLDITAKYGFKESKDLLIKLYTEVYHREPKATKDYEKILKDVNLKILKYQQRYSEEDKQQDTKGVDFEQLLINIEVTLAPLTIRDKKLYSLPKYIEMTSKKIKQNTAANGRN